MKLPDEQDAPLIKCVPLLDCNYFKSSISVSCINAQRIHNKLHKLYHETTSPRDDLNRYDSVVLITDISNILYNYTDFKLYFQFALPTSDPKDSSL